ncbi:hypothetical protein ACVWWP_008374 [Bradyrhizobium sp. LM3.6]
MRVVKTLLLVLVVAALAPYVIAPFYRIGHPVSTLMAWRSLRAAPMQREWIDLAAMSPSLPRSVGGGRGRPFLQASRHRLGRAA